MIDRARDRTYQSTVSMARGRDSFGLSSNRGKRGSSTRFAYRGAGYLYSCRGRGGGNSFPSDSPAPKREDDGTLLGEKFEKVALNDEIDAKLGFSRVQEGPRREGWLINMRPVSPNIDVYSSTAHG